MFSLLTMCKLCTVQWTYFTNNYIFSHIFLRVYFYFQKDMLRIIYIIVPDHPELIY